MRLQNEITTWLSDPKNLDSIYSRMLLKRCVELMSGKLSGYTKAEHEEAAGMSLDDMFMSQHDQPCDCAVCDDIAFRRSLKFNENDSHDELLLARAELITERALSDKFRSDEKAALSKAEFWRVSHDAACEDAKNWRRDAQDLQGQLTTLETALVEIAEYNCTTDEVWSNSMKQIAETAIKKVRG